MGNPAAWHPDPTGRHEHRWWDGERWTEHVADAGQSSIDPIEGGDSGAASEQGSDPAAGEQPSAADQGASGSAGSGHGTASDQTQPLTGQGGGSQPADTQNGGWSQPGGSAGTQSGGGWGQPGAGDAGSTGQAGWQQGGGQAGWQQGGGQAGWQQDAGQAGWQGQQQQWPQAAPAGQPTTSGSSGLAIFAMILGILSLVFFWVPFLGGLGAIVAIILGFIGRSSAKKRGVGGAGMGLAGIITGFVALVGNILITIFLFSFGGGFFGMISDYTQCMERHNDEEFCEQQLEDNLFDWFEN